MSDLRVGFRVGRGAGRGAGVCWGPGLGSGLSWVGPVFRASPGAACGVVSGPVLGAVDRRDLEPASGVVPGLRRVLGSGLVGAAFVSGSAFVPDSSPVSTPFPDLGLVFGSASGSDVSGSGLASRSGAALGPRSRLVCGAAAVLGAALAPSAGVSDSSPLPGSALVSGAGSSSIAFSDLASTSGPGVVPSPRLVAEEVGSG